VKTVKLMPCRVGSCSGYPIINRVVFGSRVPTRLIIGSGSCQTCLCNRVSRVDTNLTREPELPTLQVGDFLSYASKRVRDFVCYASEGFYSCLASRRLSCMFLV
jgi:hypothetical protein